MAHDKGLLKAFNSRDDRAPVSVQWGYVGGPQGELSFEILGKQETLTGQCRMDTESGSDPSYCIGIAMYFITAIKMN